MQTVNRATQEWRHERRQAAAARTSAILSSMNLTIGFRCVALSTICCACSALVPCQTALPSAGSCGAPAGGCCCCCCGCCSGWAAMPPGGLLEPCTGRLSGQRALQRTGARGKETDESQPSAERFCVRPARLASGCAPGGGRQRGRREAPSAGSLDSSCGQLSLGSGLAQWNVDRQRSALFARLRHCSEGRRLFG